MSEIITPAQLPIFVLLVLPGFLAAKAFDLIAAGERRDAGSLLLDSVAYGTLNLGLWYVPVAEWVLPLRDDQEGWFYFWTVLMVVVSPIALAWLFHFVVTREWMRGWVRHPTQTAWDYFFARSQSAWVLVRLKSGTMLGGWYGRGSFAGSYPDRDLYLQQVWMVDSAGKFVEPKRRSAGVLLSMADCETVEFFTAGIGVANVRQQANQRPS